MLSLILVSHLQKVTKAKSEGMGLLQQGPPVISSCTTSPLVQKFSLEIMGDYWGILETIGNYWRYWRFYWRLMEITGECCITAIHTKVL